MEGRRTWTRTLWILALAVALAAGLVVDADAVVTATYGANVLTLTGTSASESVTLGDPNPSFDSPNGFSGQPVGGFTVTGNVTAGSGCQNAYYLGSSPDVMCGNSYTDVHSVAGDLGAGDDSQRWFCGCRPEGVSNSLHGGEGSDFLTGHKLGDDLDGGPDDDFIDAEVGSDTIVGGTGTDTVSFWFDDTQSSYLRASGVTASLASGTASGANGETDTIAGFENLDGSDHADVLAGDDTANVISPRAGGGSADGKGGTDTVFGEGSAEEESTIDLAAGTMSSGSTIANFENVLGTSYLGEHIIGDAGPNVLDGGPEFNGHNGNDTIEGGGGADALLGGGDDDHLIARDGGNDTSIDCGAGNDVADIDLDPFDPFGILVGCETVNRAAPGSGGNGGGTGGDGGGTPPADQQPPPTGNPPAGGGTPPAPPQPPPPPPPPAPFDGLTLGGTKTVGVVDGTVTLPLTCPADSVGNCVGTDTLQTATKVVPLRRLAKRRRAKILTLGKGRFSIPPGAKGKVRIKLSKAALKLLAKHRRLKVKQRIVAHDSRNTSTTTVGTITLKAPKKTR
ncbi:MAG TPA: hypothetical protein VF549_15970 [Solirubrobacteraceae bacterium]|jgi:hypothetical protein